MNNNLTHPDVSVDINITNFEILCQLTLAIPGIKAFPPNTFTPTGNRWSELAKSWNTLFPCGSYGIFQEASHRIMWKTPSQNSKPEYDALIRVVISELLSDGEAFAAWDTCAGFEAALGYVTSEMTPHIDNGDDYNHSIEHYHYVCDKALLKIRYSKAKYIAESPGYEKEIIAYESAIKKIVPSAATWREEDWLNESHVFDELLKLYGVDYRDIDPIEYGRILLILMDDEEDVEQRELNEAWYASNIHTLPLSLASAIWPINTEEKILQLFVYAAQCANIQNYGDETIAWTKSKYLHPVGAFSTQNLRASWLFPFVNDWIASHHITGESDRENKRVIFEVLLNI